MREDLYEELIIVMHDNIWSQILDYWKLSFRCYICHRVSHLQKYCSVRKEIPRFKKVWVKKNTNITRTDTTKGDKNVKGVEGKTSMKPWVDRCIEKGKAQFCRDSPVIKVDHTDG